MTEARAAAKGAEADKQVDGLDDAEVAAALAQRGVTVEQARCAFVIITAITSI